MFELDVHKKEGFTLALTHKRKTYIYGNKLLLYTFETFSRVRIRLGVLTLLMVLFKIKTQKCKIKIHNVIY